MIIEKDEISQEKINKYANGYFPKIKEYMKNHTKKECFIKIEEWYLDYLISDETEQIRGLDQKKYWIIFVIKIADTYLYKN